MLIKLQNTDIYQLTVYAWKSVVGILREGYDLCRFRGRMNYVLQ